MRNLYHGFDFLGRLLDVSSLRARVLAHNVANQSTPGYKRMAVRFEETLRKALRSPGPIDLDILQGEVHEPKGGLVKPNGNNVTLEQEIATNVKNQIYFHVVNEALRWRFGLHREAFQER
jgi:flagellar basal-body rod protein FlgB